MLDRIRDRRWQEHSKSQCWLTILLSAAIAAPAAEAQVSGDNSLGTLVNDSLTASCQDALCTITGGTLSSSGSTLLHSFEQFTSPENAPGYSALFVDPGASDIVVRVTGGTPSFLNGTLSTSSGSIANLFFVNPSGITFGADAKLAIGGSFLASTADEVIFADGIRLMAREANAPALELLTVSAPVGLGFLPGSANGSVQLQGTGNRLTFGSPTAPDSQFVNRIFQEPLPPGSPFPPLPPPSDLSVLPGQTISVVANGIELDGASLSASGGRIELGSVETGRVGINSDGSIGYDQVDQFADISIAKRSALEVSASTSGNIRLNGKDISVLESSALLAETLPSVVLPPANPVSPGGIDIAATGDVEVSGFTVDPSIPFNPPFFSYLSVDAAPGASGGGGQFNLQAQTLTVRDGGQISAITYGSGKGGQIDINARDAVVLEGGSPFGPSGLFAVADSLGSGDSGQISVETQQLKMFGGAQINTSSFTTGTAGLLQLAADRVELIGTSAPVEIPTPDGLFQVVSPTAVRSDMGETSVGKGRLIQIETGELFIFEGAEVVSGTSGAGEAGDIEIVADDVVVSGRTPLGTEGPSSVLSVVAPGAFGNGGALTIEADRLQILESAQVGTSTAGSGRAGNLAVKNAQSVLVSGQTSLGRSGLFANAINGSGAGGNLSVETAVLRVRDGGTLNVSNFPSGTDAQLPPGQGDAGNLQVNAGQIFLSEGGIVSADTAAGDRGNISLQTQTLSLRQSSRITANATGMSTGGNINISAPDGFIVAVPDENSDITANAVFGDGGRIDITAQSILGIEPRPALTPLSDITASSEFGLSGETRLETLGVELRTDNTPLPQSTEILQVAQGCSATGSASSRFVQSGRGGLSNSPYGMLNSRESLADTSLPSSLAGSAISEAGSSANAALTEAQGWTTNSQGDVMLLAADALEADRCVSWE